MKYGIPLDACYFFIVMLPLFYCLMYFYITYLHYIACMSSPKQIPFQANKILLTYLLTSSKDEFHLKKSYNNIQFPACLAFSDYHLLMSVWHMSNTALVVSILINPLSPDFWIWHLLHKPPSMLAMSSRYSAWLSGSNHPSLKLFPKHGEYDFQLT